MQAGTAQARRCGLLFSLLIVLQGPTALAQPSNAVPLRKANVTVAAEGPADFHTVQSAIDALPPDGGIVHIRPGVYRETVTITKPGVRLEGDKADPAKVVIVFNNSHGTAGGTLKSATVSVTGDNFFAQGITFANDFSVGKPLTQAGAQAVALMIRGDRAVFRYVRMLGFQDTLFAGSKSCVSEQGPCTPSRQYFSDCYVEGNVDFIFGDGKTFFQDCEVRALAHDTVFLTAQSKHYPEEPSGFVFDSCRVTADQGAQHIFLGRPWRPYSTVVFLNSNLPATIEPAGWREWHPGETHSMETVTYAEFRSKGPGADFTRRDPHSRQLRPHDAQVFSVREFLRGEDGWDPTQVH